MEAQPLELVIGNIVRRVLFIIREEHAGKLKEKNGQGSISRSVCVYDRRRLDLYDWLPAVHGVVLYASSIRNRRCTRACNNT